MGDLIALGAEGVQSAQEFPLGADEQAVMDFADNERPEYGYLLRFLEKLDEALYQGAVLRVRPKAMTVAVIIAGLLPILWGTGAGSEVMSRIAAPMIGGMITAPLLSLFIIPAAYKLIWLRRYKKQ